VRPETSEVEVLLSDPSRARELLGWSAAVELDEGVERTARWVEKHLDRYDPDRYHV
jgi:nucleoside-diphosphate-sugar epimerase